ncbi:transporter substrate-binding domain-containing protein [Labrys wisconsinensis]|uniref:Polar amino acid transport system substrate-binding protein n=1 Tax=Labrys wisconsinensis TaxID=425677 RepID=A0ABU0JL81_9HYPH|nr:transporter substrate-binding domain-containing protein [Labrys wisconsinensis]MDQ0474226.1 polar amino acid transport system substrate-binding protein [Labrys wisconsinensis]
MPNQPLDRRALLGASLLAGMGGAALALPAAAQSSAGAAGDDKLQEVLSRGHLIVGTGTDIPPFYFRQENGDLAGFEIDLARLLAKGLFNDPGKVEFVTQTSDARIPNLLANRIDLTIQNLTVTAGRALQIDFTVPYYRDGQGFLLRADGRYRDFAALKAAGADTTISAIQNVFIESWIREVLPDAKVEQFATPDAALQALNAGRADAHYITYSRIPWTLKQLPGRYLDSGFSHRAGSVACGIRQGQPRWLSFLDTALREAMTGVDFAAYAALFKTWLDTDLPAPRTGQPHEFAA